MPTEPPNTGSTLQLAFKSHPKKEEQPVRACMVEGSLWFAARDICRIMSLPYEVVIPHFDAIALDTDMAPFQFDDVPELVLSPIGVYKLCSKNETVLTVKVATWSRREANERLPDALPTDARLFLTLDPEGARPPYPNKYTGRLGEWKGLLFNPNYRTTTAIMWARAHAEIKAQQGEWLLSPEERAARAEEAAAQRAASDESLDRFIASIAANSRARAANATYVPG